MIGFNLEKSSYQICFIVRPLQLRFLALPMVKMGISCLPFRSKHRCYCCERGFKCLLSLKNLFRKIKSLRELVHHILNVFGCNCLMYYVDLMSQVPHFTLYFDCMSCLWFWHVVMSYGSPMFDYGFGKSQK